MYDGVRWVNSEFFPRRGKRATESGTTQEARTKAEIEAIDPDKDYAIALSRFGISVSAFLDLTPKEFFLALKDRSEYDVDVVEGTLKPICESIRLSTLKLINVQLKRSDQITNPRKLWVHYWEKRVFKKPQTREEMKSVMKSIARAYKKKK